MIKTKTMLSGTLTLKSGSALNVEDTENGMFATRAVADFKAGNRIKLEPAPQAVILVPYHSIALLAVTASVTSSEITDDFCLAPGEGGGDDDPKEGGK